jgi:hypothetical protein
MKCFEPTGPGLMYIYLLMRQRPGISKEASGNTITAQSLSSIESSALSLLRACGSLLSTDRTNRRSVTATSAIYRRQFCRISLRFGGFISRQQVPRPRRSLRRGNEGNPETAGPPVNRHHQTSGLANQRLIFVPDKDPEFQNPRRLGRTIIKDHEGSHNL